MGKTKKLPKHEEAFKVLLRYEKETDLSKLAEGVNRIAAIHESLKSEMEQKCGHKDFTEVKGLDFNGYYHDQIYEVNYPSTPRGDRWASEVNTLSIDNSSFRFLRLRPTVK